MASKKKNQLNAPKRGTFYVACGLGLVGIIASFVGGISGAASIIGFIGLAAGLILLALSCYLSDL